MPPPDPNQTRWVADQLQVHEPMLRAWLQCRFPKLTDIDDIVQEAYLRVLAAKRKNEMKAPKAFFFATARNLALDHFRRLKTTNVEAVGSVDELSLLEDAEDAAEIIARNQDIELMTQAVQSLPDRCRQVLTLRIIYCMSHKEIAAELGISVRTVEAQVAIGVKRCTQFVLRASAPPAP